MTMRRTVTAKDAASVTMSMEMTVAGRKMPAQTVRIPFDRPYDPAAKPGQPQGSVEKVAEGTETLTVGGKEYACQWIQSRHTAGERTTEGKVWICRDVPLGGLVKTDTTSGEHKMTMTMTGCGKGG